VLRSLATSLGLADGDAAFVYRPLQESPVFLRRQTWQDLQRPWTDGRARLYNPPTDLATLRLAKIQRENAPGVVVLPHWPGSTWLASLRKMATSWKFASAETARDKGGQAPYERAVGDGRGDGEYAGSGLGDAPATQPSVASRTADACPFAPVATIGIALSAPSAPHTPALVTDTARPSGAVAACC
jgi:hypothetical protein